MRFTQILFKTPMVQAVMEGTKTQTRRTRGLYAINQNPDEWELVHLGRFNCQKPELCVRMYHNPSGRPMTIKVPYGYPGSGLWVRETFTPIVIINYDPPGELIDKEFWYKADSNQIEEKHGNIKNGLGERFIDSIKWKPSIFMPKGACRIFLQIESIRLERLNDISRRDAVKEGIEVQNSEALDFQYKDYMDSGMVFKNPVGSFRSLWESIHGEGSWKDNPWLWVVDFKRIEMPKDWPNTK